MVSLNLIPTVSFPDFVILIASLKDAAKRFFASKILLISKSAKTHEIISILCIAFIKTHTKTVIYIPNSILYILQPSRSQRKIKNSISTLSIFITNCIILVIAMIVS
jgi:hypothetical protein